MKYICFTIAFFFIIGLTSCEGIVGDSGHVYSMSTKEPLDSVKITLLIDNLSSQMTYTDSTGYFENTRFVGCTPKCPNSKLKFVKKGYKTLLIDVEKYLKKHPQPNGYITINLEELK